MQPELESLTVLRMPRWDLPSVLPTQATSAGVQLVSFPGKTHIPTPLPNSPLLGLQALSWSRWPRRQGHPDPRPSHSCLVYPVRAGDTRRGPRGLHLPGSGVLSFSRCAQHPPLSSLSLERGPHPQADALARALRRDCAAGRALNVTGPVLSPPLTACPPRAGMLAPQSLCAWECRSRGEGRHPFPLPLPVPRPAFSSYGHRHREGCWIQGITVSRRMATPLSPLRLASQLCL